MKFGAVHRRFHGMFMLVLTLGTPAAVVATQQPLENQSAAAQENPGTPRTQDNRPVAAPPMDQRVAPPPVPPSAATTRSPVVPPPIVAPSPPPSTVKPLKKGPVDALKPGQFVWVAQDTYEGPMKIVVVLDIQRIYVFQNDKLIGFSTISSGKKGKETPTGYFTILQKNIDHKSNLYSNAPMPFMQRLTWDGIAMHGGQLPGYPASHGCIRLPQTFAKALYGVTQLNQEVYVLRDTATPVKKPEPIPPVDTTIVPPPPVVAPPSVQPDLPPVY